MASVMVLEDESPTIRLVTYERAQFYGVTAYGLARVDPVKAEWLWRVQQEFEEAQEFLRSLPIKAVM